MNTPVKRIRLIHGFNVSDQGLNSVGNLKRELRNYIEEHHLNIELEIVSYPWAFVLTVALKNRAVVNYIVETSKPGDLLIGHSNGCWIALQASEIIDDIHYLMFINPALHVRHEFPLHIKKAIVVFSPGDRAVWLGKLWRRFTNLFPWRWYRKHGWGEMGRKGYLGKHKNVINYEVEKKYRHSGLFRDHEGLVILINLIHKHFLPKLENIIINEDKLPN